MICLPGHPASAGGTMSGSAFVWGVNALFERAPIEHAAEAPFRFSGQAAPPGAFLDLRAARRIPVAGRHPVPGADHRRRPVAK